MYPSSKQGRRFLAAREWKLGLAIVETLEQRQLLSAGAVEYELYWRGTNGLSTSYTITHVGEQTLVDLLALPGRLSSPYHFRLETQLSEEAAAAISQTPLQAQSAAPPDASSASPSAAQSAAPIGASDSAADLATVFAGRVGIVWGDGSTSRSDLSPQDFQMVEHAGQLYVTARHEYASSGTFNARLAIFEPDGVRGGIPLQFDIDPPGGRMTMDYEGDPLEPVPPMSATMIGVNGTAIVVAHDKRAGSPEEVMETVIDWGDGTWSGYDEAWEDEGYSGVLIRGEHEYEEEGTYDAVMSQSCAGAVWEIDVGVVPAWGFEAEVTEDRVLGMTVAQFIAFDPEQDPEDFTATIEWDGTNSTSGTIGEDTCGTFSVWGEYTYSEPGMYYPEIHITDGEAYDFTVYATVQVWAKPLVSIGGYGPFHEGDGDGLYAFCIHRSNNPHIGLMVHLSAPGGTASGAYDYSPNGGWGSYTWIEPDQYDKWLFLDVVDDQESEPEESVTMAVCDDYGNLDYDVDNNARQTSVTIIDNDAPTPLVVQVAFDASTPGDCYEVYRDDDTGPYSAPQWKDNSNPHDGDAADPGDQVYPVAYVRGSMMKLTAQIEFSSAPSGRILVMGDGPGSYDFFADTDSYGDPNHTATLDGATLTVTSIAAAALANVVDYFESFVVDWSVSLDGGTTWVSAGITNNDVFVVLAAPTATVYHTLVKVACEQAQGESNAGAIPDEIWNAFAGGHFCAADGTPLTFYANYRSTNETTAALLKNHDGNCRAWARLFIETLKQHGIGGASRVKLTPKTPPDMGFIMYTWTLDCSGGKSDDPNYQYLNLAKRVSDSSFNDLVGDGTSGYHFRYAEVIDETGVPAQNNENPASMFGNHEVVKIGTMYYDPSAGKRYASLDDLESDMIECYFRVAATTRDEPVFNCDLNGNGNSTDLNVPVWAYYFREKTTQNQLKEEVLPDN